MYKLSELAEALARKAVLTAEMKKQAVDGIGEWWAGLSPALRYGLAGAGIGAGGAGLISALTGRRRKQSIRDALLGGLVGGAGGAAYSLIPSTIEDIKRQAGRFFGKGEPGRLTRAGRIATDPTTYKAALPFAAGAAVGTERISRAAEAAGAAREALAAQQRAVRETVGKRVSEFERGMFGKGFRGIRAKPEAFVSPAERAIVRGKQLVPYRSGFLRAPTGKSLLRGLKGGVGGLLGLAALQTLVGSGEGGFRLF